MRELCSKFHFLSIGAFITIHLFVTACGGSSNRGDDRLDFERPGSRVGNFDLAYYDDLPSVSSDGRSIAFISGRSGRLESYIVALESGDDGLKASVPRRLLLEESETGEELKVFLSPDASFALLFATKDGAKPVLYSANVADQSVHQISEDVFFEVAPVVSSDEALFAYVRQQEAGFQVVLQEVVEGAPTDNSAVLDYDGQVPTALQFVSSGSGYRLIVVSGLPISRYEYQFATIAAADGLDADTTSQDLAGDLRLPYDLAGGDLFAARRLASSEQASLEVLGDLAEGKSQISQRHALVRHGASGEPAAIDFPGFQLLDVASNVSSDVIASLSQARIECQHGDNGYGNVISLGSGGEQMELVVPWYHEAGWQLRLSVCPEEEEEATADWRIFSLALNLTATIENHVLVYVTGFSPKAGVLGSQEIYAVIKDGDEANLLQISQNPAPSPE